MNTRLLSLLPVILIVCAPALALAARAPAPGAVALKGGESPAEIEAAYAQAIAALAPDLAKSDGAPLRTFESTLHHAARPGAEVERAACCRAIATALQTPIPAEAKAWMLKLSAFAAGQELVPVVAGLLRDSDSLVRESARCALQQIPLVTAAEALRSALREASDPAWKAALTLALGARRDTASVPLIKPLLSAEAPAGEAAFVALGQIADAEAAAALLAALPKARVALRLLAAEACLKCAEQMLRQNQPAQALRLYRDLDQASQPRSIRLAAVTGLLRCAGEDTAERIVELLNSPDADRKQTAAGFISELDSLRVPKLAAEMGRLPAENQVVILAALADRGEGAARPAALAAARSEQETLRVAGLRALGRVGDASTAALLIQAMQAGGTAGAAARQSLLQLEARGCNEAILEAMRKETDAPRRTELIGLIEARNMSAAAPTLSGELASSEADVRRAAMRALGRLASPQELLPMLQALLKAPAGSEREEGERAVAAVCGRVSDPARQTAPVLRAYDNTTAEGQAVLLPLLGRLGGNSALERIKTALAGSDPALQKAAEAALMNWPEADDAVEKELLAIADRSQKPGERAAALRAYIRVIAMPSGLPEKARLAKFQKAMDLAGADAERLLVLERVTEIKHIETLRFLALFLNKPALAVRAANSICDLARERGLKERNKAEFELALNKIVETVQDQAATDRARRRLAEK